MHPVHHALGIQDHSELTRFYRDILGMEEISRRDLSPELSREIFGKMNGTEFHYYRRDRLLLELFIDPEMESPAGFAHLCFSVNDRGALINRATAAGYPVVRIPRRDHDLVFLRDGSGNLFEIKDKMPET